MLTLYSVYNETRNRNWILERCKFQFCIDYMCCWMITSVILYWFAPNFLKALQKTANSLPPPLIERTNERCMWPLHLSVCVNSMLRREHFKWQVVVTARRLRLAVTRQRRTDVCVRRSTVRGQGGGDGARSWLRRHRHHAHSHVTCSAHSRCRLPHSYRVGTLHTAFTVFSCHVYRPRIHDDHWSERSE